LSEPGDFRINPESLRAASLQTRRHAQHLTAAAEKLRSRVLGAGSPWGSDEMGTVFATAYTECTQMGLGVLTDLGLHLDEMATSLAQMSDNTQSTDEANAAGFKQIY
jgi:uncharacterized protein YukE